MIKEEGWRARPRRIDPRREDLPTPSEETAEETAEVAILTSVNRRRLGGPRASHLLWILLLRIPLARCTDVNVALVVDSSYSQYATAVMDAAVSEMKAVNTLGTVQYNYNVQYDGSGKCQKGIGLEGSVSAIVDFYYKKNIRAVFGPTCFTDLEIAARLTNEWDILQFNFWTDHPSDYMVNSIITMTTRSTINMAENIYAFLLGVDWKKITIISCDDCYSRMEIAAVRERTANISRYLIANEIEVTSTHQTFQNYTVDNYDSVMKGVMTSTRVILPFIGDTMADYVNLQMAMARNNFSELEYSTVIVMADYRFDSLALPFGPTDDLADSFSGVVMLYNDNFDPAKVGPFLNKTKVPKDDLLTYLQLEESLYVFNNLLQHSPPDANISANSLLQNLGEVTGPFGTITFNTKAHRIAPYSVYNIVNGSIKFVNKMYNGGESSPKGGCTMDGQCLRYNAPPGVFFPGQPTCGFSGELCDQTGTVIIIAAVMACVFLTVGVFVGVRRLRMGESSSMPWMVPRAKLEVIDLNNMRASQHMSIMSLQAHMEEQVQAQTRAFMEGKKMGSIEQQYVIIDQYIQKERLMFDKTDTYLLFQLKQMNHDNVNPFMGLSFERNSDLHVLWTYCFRGSLNEVIFSKEKALESENFKGAFVRDLLKGLEYVHTSPIGYHGSLTPGCCYVDSHWILKLSGFGMNRMLYKWKNNNTISTKDGKPLLPNHDLYYYAPEIRKLLKTLMYTNRIETVFLPNKPGQSADMYSFGVILFEILYRKKLFEVEELMAVESDEDNLILCEQADALLPLYPSIPSTLEEVHPDLTSLMHKCWSGQLDTRPDASLARKITDATLKMSGSLVDQMIKNMELYTTGLQQTVKERTAELETEQKMADELLRELLPQTIVDDLKLGRKVEAKNYKSVTVMYSDIVGFTSLCSESQPMEVVALLSGMFDNFDKIISEHDGYKMETIGDAYCVASGIPTPNKLEHVRNIATIALKQRAYLTTFEIPHRPGQYLHCRWGFNTGPVFTGVVGVRAPRYSVFGQSVTIASKMENLGIPDKIQMTLKSHQILASRYPEFRCSPRGSTKVPGVGTLLTYWLDGIEDLLKSDRAEFKRAIDEHESGGLDDPYTFNKKDPPTVSSATSVTPLIVEETEF